MARIISLIVLALALASCARIQPPGSGLAYPYDGPLTDNAGKQVERPQYGNTNICTHLH